MDQPDVKVKFKQRSYESKREFNQRMHDECTNALKMAEGNKGRNIVKEYVGRRVYTLVTLVLTVAINKTVISRIRTHADRITDHKKIKVRDHLAIRAKNRFC